MDAGIRLVPRKKADIFILERSVEGRALKLAASIRRTAPMGQLEQRAYDPWNVPLR